MKSAAVEVWVKPEYINGPFPSFVPKPGTCPQPVCKSCSWYLFLGTLVTDRNLVFTNIPGVAAGLPKPDVSNPSWPDLDTSVDECLLDPDVLAPCPDSRRATGSGGIMTEEVTIPEGRWTHVTATFKNRRDGSAMPYEMKLYLDGKEQRILTEFQPCTPGGQTYQYRNRTNNPISLTGTNAAGDPVPGQSDLRFGQFRIPQARLDYQYTGKLCGIRIYDRALESNEICADISSDTSSTIVQDFTPSIDFGPVAEGLVTAQPIKLRIIGCYIGAVQSLFTTAAGPFGLLVSSEPIEGGLGYDETQEVTLWVSYRTEGVGTSASTSVRVEIPDIGFSEEIPVIARTIARPTVSAALVLDRSDSMSGNTGVPGIDKIRLLREAARTFVNLMRDGDQLAIARYNHDSLPPHFPLTDVGPEDLGVGRSEAITFINGAELDPAGFTSIGDGIFEASNLLSASTATVQALVVMTDGIENRDRFLSHPDVTSRLTDQVYAVGLGSTSSISTSALETLVGGPDSYLIITGEIDTNNRFRLTKYYIQILSDISNMDIERDPQGVIVGSKVQSHPFYINETDIEMDVILLSPNPEAIRFELEAPNGTRINPANIDTYPNVKYFVKEDLAFYRIRLPIFIDSPKQDIGRWKAQFGHTKGQPDLTHLNDVQIETSFPYSFLVRKRSNFKFDLNLAQNSLGVGGEIHLEALIKEYGIPVDNRFTLQAQIERPNGSTETIPLQFERNGCYRASIGNILLPGSYTVRVLARGSTMQGNVVEREKTLTGAIIQEANDSPGTNEIGNILPQLQNLVNGLSNLVKYCIISVMLLLIIIVILILI